LEDLIYANPSWRVDCDFAVYMVWTRLPILKLGWGIIHDCISLWARVLRGKYICSKDHNIPQVQAKGKNSPLWKAICKIWPKLYKLVNREW